MTTHTDATDLDMLGWNVLNGGIDGDQENRRERQIGFLASLPDLDVLWIMEATNWHEGNRFADLADATGLTALPHVTSANGDGVNHLYLYYRAGKLRLPPPSRELARGAVHHGVARAEFEVNGVRLLVLGAHLTHSSPSNRLREVRKPTVGYRYQNKQVPLHLDQVLVTGRRIEVVDCRILGAPHSFAPDIPTPDAPGMDIPLTDLADHLPVHLRIPLHRSPIRTAS